LAARKVAVMMWGLAWMACCHTSLPVATTNAANSAASAATAAPAAVASVRTVPKTKRAASVAPVAASRCMRQGIVPMGNDWNSRPNRVMKA
jgi:hypothetical protein